MKEITDKNDALAFLGARDEKHANRIFKTECPELKLIIKKDQLIVNDGLVDYPMNYPISVWQFWTDCDEIADSVSDKSKNSNLEEHQQLYDFANFGE